MSSLATYPEPTESEIQSLLETLKFSHKHNDDNALQTNAINECTDYIQKYYNPQRHLFCDRSMYHASIYCLILFSFPPDSEPLLWFQRLAAESLDKCSRCVAMFHRGRARLKIIFATERGIDATSLDSFMSLIFKWEGDRLFQRLDGDYQEYNRMKSLDSKTELPRSLLLGIQECLCGPQLIRDSESPLRQLYDKVLYMLLASDHSYTTKVSSLTPGLIFLANDGNSVQKKWAFRMLDSLYDRESLLRPDQVHPELLEELFFRFVCINSPQFDDDYNSELFYRTILPLFKLMDGNAIFQRCMKPVDYESIKKCISFDILSFCLKVEEHIRRQLPKTTPYLLRFLSLLLTRLGNRFWSEIAPFTFHNIIDNIINSPVYLRYFETLPDMQTVQGDLNPDARLNDLLDWIDPFVASLESSQQQQTYNKISLFLVTMVELPNNIPLSTKSALFMKACSLVSSALSLKHKLYGNSFVPDLLLRSDARVVVDTKLQRFMDYAVSKAIFFPEKMMEKNATVAKASMDVICKALRYDILKLAQNSYDLKTGIKPSTLRYSSLLFKSILKQNFAVQTELAYLLLSSMENVSTIVPVPSSDIAANASESLKALRLSQNEESSSFLKLLVQFFENFSDIDSANSKLILSNSRSLKGYWACVFSSNDQVYQNAINILYEAFDAIARSESIHSLLEKNMDACIEAINDNITNLIFIKFHEPCPKAVTILQDVIQELNSPIDGLFNKVGALTDRATRKIIIFWNTCWQFLNMIYIETFVWSRHYELVEFTRNTLDLSHAVLECFVSISSFQKGLEMTLYKDIISTFPNMLGWLRLSDPGLLASCASLTTKALQMAEQLNLQLDNDVIELLAKYGSKAKKFSNKLSDQQSNEILSKARIFNKPLVDKIVQESEDYRNAKLESSRTTSPYPSSKSSVTPTPSNSSREPTPTLSFSSSSSFNSLTSKRQMKITDYGKSVTSNPIIPTGKVTLPKSALQLAREQIEAKKALDVKKNTQSTRVIHPARAPGFNMKTKKYDDSSDEEEFMDTKELFNIPQAKKASVAIVNADGSSMRKPTNNALDKKREVENMKKRLNVDLNPLYVKILLWSYKRDGDYPSSEIRDQVKQVADTFKSSADYIQTYEPLLLLECWQAIVAARTRQADKPISSVIASKKSVNDFFEVFISLTKQEVTDRGFSESDLVVLAVRENENAPPTHKELEKSLTSCLGKIHDIKYVKGDNADITIRITRSASLNNSLTAGLPVIIMKLMQMTTIEREYSSLYGLEYYNLSKQIFEARAGAPTILPSSKISKIQETYGVNESQAKAIGSSVETSGFSLIQGPPGTGKTKTILGVIGYMISSFESESSKTIEVNVSLVPDRNSISKSILEARKAKKVLVCAPSNAAVDELVLRLKSGLMNSKGEKYVPNLVRLGRSDAINAAVKDRTLEELVDSQLGRSTPVTNNMASLRKQLDEIKTKITVCNAKIDAQILPDDNLFHERRKLRSEQNKIKQDLDQEREKQTSAYRSREIDRKRIQAKILNEAEIICSTLSGSAHDMVANLGITFDSVIIDEACQCTELSAVIPLRYGCRRCIMVGDPNQLPPTVLSGVASESKYDQSLFVRMAKNTKPLLLNVQYRMNSAISAFPSKKFYDGELKNGSGIDFLTKREWHEDPRFPPYKFFNITEGSQSQNSKTFSYTNKVEVDIAVEMVDLFFKKYTKLDMTNKIGIITPYKEQNRLLQQVFVKKYGNNIKREISFNTIDGFQGQEKEIIIMSCVRADPLKKGVGFLRDFRRMNVALTRPKCSLWILGHKESLIKNNLWADLISDAADRGCLSDAVAGFTSTGVAKNAEDIEERKFPKSKEATREQEDHIWKDIEENSNPNKNETSGKLDFKRPKKTKKKGRLSSDIEVAQSGTGYGDRSSEPTAEPPKGPKKVSFNRIKDRYSSNNSSELPTPNRSSKLSNKDSSTSTLVTASTPVSSTLPNPRSTGVVSNDNSNQHKASFNKYNPNGFTSSSYNSYGHGEQQSYYTRKQRSNVKFNNGNPQFSRDNTNNNTSYDMGINNNNNSNNYNLDDYNVNGNSNFNGNQSDTNNAGDKDRSFNPSRTGQLPPPPTKSQKRAHGGSSNIFITKRKR